MTAPSLSLALAGLDDSGRPREQLAAIAAAGYRWVQINAAQAGFRPRELDASARRDLAASLSRSGLRLSGLDLFIAREDFENAAKIDRAMAAAVGAAELLRDMMALRAAEPGAAVSVIIGVGMAETASLAQCADQVGVQFADHAAAPDDRLSLGVDPALLLSAGADPAKAVFERQTRLVAARLGDANLVGRCELGAGRLDILGYAMALAAVGFHNPVVADMRGLPQPYESATRALQLWQRVTALPAT
ncbi:MAG: sugar phosphate isomerase/epimerase [Phycisphaeraceae bacterium]|nr:sugar phosphate isomerase/epimerase [Phycisphaeraceae bacterium]MCW5762554.1 sugar phosphate isomerase/epimerase [Phycisphaeraceae bacterium]